MAKVDMLRKLNYVMKGICYRNADGAFATKKNRYDTLQLIANELRELGWKDLHHPNNLKPKHVYSLLGKWRGGEEKLHSALFYLTVRMLTRAITSVPFFGHLDRRLQPGI